MWLGTGGPSMGSDARQSVQLGLTKTFLRKEAHDMLEGRRSRRFLAAARTMQSFVRAAKFRRTFLAKKWAINLLQRVYRGHLGRQKANMIRRVSAAITVQTAFRMHYTRCVIIDYQRED